MFLCKHLIAIEFHVFHILSKFCTFVTSNSILTVLLSAGFIMAAYIVMWDVQSHVHLVATTPALKL